MSIKNDLIRVGSSNLILLLSGGINAFFIPKILTISDYSEFKTYLMYVGFLGMFHFGYVDGIHAYFGGETRLSNTKTKECSIYFSFHLFVQILVTITLLLVSIFFKSNQVIILTILTILPVNLNSYILFFCQSIGNFKNYAKIVIIAPLINLLVIFLFYNNLTINILIYTYIGSTIISLFYALLSNKYLIKYSTMSNIIRSLYIYRFKIKSLFKIGIAFLIGNLVFLMFFDLGRLYTKFFKNSNDFAYYSFGVSLMTLIIIIVNSLNKTLYPYLFNIKANKLKKIFVYLSIFGSFAMTSYYLVSYIVINYIPNYTNSLKLTGILFSSIPGAIIIKSVYHNQYRIEKLENVFLIDSIKYLTIGVMITLIISTFKIISIEEIGIICVGVIYLWTFYPNRKLNLKSEINNVKWYIINSVFVFLICQNLDLNLINKVILTSLFLVIILLIFKKNILKSYNPS